VVVVPAEELDRVIQAAKRIVAAEKELERAIRRGADLGELLRTDDAIERKRSEVFIPQLRGKAGR